MFLFFFSFALFYHLDCRSFASFLCKMQVKRLVSWMSSELEPVTAFRLVVDRLCIFGCHSSLAFVSKSVNDLTDITRLLSQSIVLPSSLCLSFRSCVGGLIAAQMV